MCDATGHAIHDPVHVLPGLGGSGQDHGPSSMMTTGHQDDATTVPTKCASHGKRLRCYQCRKRIGTIMIDCACGQQYCLAHRHPESHNCPCLQDRIQIDRARLSTVLMTGKIDETRNHNPLDRV